MFFVAAQVATAGTRTTRSALVADLAVGCLRRQDFLDSETIDPSTPLPDNVIPFDLGGHGYPLYI